jgi:hypothetical protein
MKHVMNRWFYHRKTGGIDVKEDKPESLGLNGSGRTYFASIWHNHGGQLDYIGNYDIIAGSSLLCNDLLAIGMEMVGADNEIGSSSGRRFVYDDEET